MPRKQRSTWGCVQKMGRDKWRLRYQTPEGRRSKTVYGSRREADAEMAKLRVRLEEEREHGPRPTFRECWERWYWPSVQERLAKEEVARQTVSTYQSLWDKHVSPRWADVCMSSVKPMDYQEWLLGLTWSSARQSDIVIGNLAKCARLHGSTVTFKDISYRMPKKKTSGNDGVWSRQEMDAIVRALRGTVCEVPAILMAFGSCRVGEACAPLLSDLSMAKCRGLTFALVRIDKQVAQKLSVIERLKTEQSVRTVVVPEPWSLRLSEIAEEALRNGDEYLNDDGTGNPVPRHRVALKWSAMYRDGKMPVKKLPMTRLRNSWETYTHWVLGIDKDKVDKMMGHVNADVRSRHYDRPDEILFMETIANAIIEKAPERTI